MDLKGLEWGEEQIKKSFFKNENFIDYNLDEIQDDILDLYFIKKCEFI